MSERRRPADPLGATALVLLLGAAAWAVGAAASSPAAARVAHEVGAALGAGARDDLVAVLPRGRGVRVGAPVYPADESRGQDPIAHVAAVDALADGGLRVRVRFAHGVDPQGPWRLDALPPTRRLVEAMEKAVPPDVLRAYAARLRERALSLWSDTLQPDLEARLPAFLGRLRPAEGGATRELLDRLGAALTARLSPLLDDLMREVRTALDREFDFLDRMGLLWKVATGDDKGLEGKVAPVAREAARRWWTTHREEVLAAVGRALADEGAQIRTWAAGELLAAAREELLEPVLERNGARLEAEAEALLRDAAETFVRAPDGGLRVRFAAVVRDALLRKDEPLLLLARPDPAEPRPR